MNVWHKVKGGARFSLEINMQTIHLKKSKCILFAVESIRTSLYDTKIMLKFNRMRPENDIYTDFS